MNIYQQVICYVGRELKTAFSLENGIKADRDPELLYDYRVGIRRSRTVIGMPGVFIREDARLINSFLAYCMSRTGRLRDLDVMIDDLKDLPGFERFHENIRIERGKACSEMAAFLRSGEYVRLKRFVLNSIRNAGLLRPGPAACEEVNTFTAGVCSRFYDDTLAAAVIGADSPDYQIHKLRIQCKKLRYVLSFSAEVLSGPVCEIIEVLKDLQNGLGRSNDISVQIAILSEAEGDAEEIIERLTILKEASCRMIAAGINELRSVEVKTLFDRLS